MKFALPIVLVTVLFSQCNISKNSVPNQQADQQKHILHRGFYRGTASMDYSGYERVVIRKKHANGKYVITQDAFTKDSTIYVLQDDYDLNGCTITVPSNSVLDFWRGSLKNGTLKGRNTVIINKLNRKILKNVILSGNYIQEYVNSEWLEYDDLSKMFDAIQTLATSDICTRVVVNKIIATYTPVVRSYYLGEKVGYLFKIPSNTVVDFCGSMLTLAPNDISFFYAIYIQDVENVIVKNLTLIGDVEGHTPTKYNEYSHGIYIYAVHDVKVENITSTKFWGDGMGISGYADATKPHNTNVIVRNCKFVKNRRQGCSISKGENLHFDNCDFIETGTIKTTPPSAGVDIEPNNGNDVLKNIVFNKCKFLGNEGNYGGLLIMTARLDNDLDAEEIRLVDCEIDGVHQYGKGGGYFKACVITNSKNRSNCLNASKNLIVEGCIMDFNKTNLKTRKSSDIIYINNCFPAN